MNTIEFIVSQLSSVTKEQTSASLTSLDIDSIDFVTLRVSIEKEMGVDVPDSIWTSINSLDELANSVDKITSSQSQITENTDSSINGRDICINMPHMCLGGLSENWLFKELGDFHWHQLCIGLGTTSDKIDDELGNRLYATIVRIRYESERNLKTFQENEYLTINTNMSRYGKSMYFSDNKIRSDLSSLDMSVMTTFSTRGDDNSNLTKGQPNNKLNNEISESMALPDFGSTYRDFRKGTITKHELNGFEFNISEESLFEYEYTINPYYDINGVNLLYFAAYPVISDFCESIYFQNSQSVKTQQSWPLDVYPLAKDVFYFNNCDVDDQIIYRLHGYELMENNLIAIQSSLTRKKDNSMMARIFSVKERNI